MIDLAAYWEACLSQDAERMAAFLHPEALIFWHNTNECFTASGFITANCRYPGVWTGGIERLVEAGDTCIAAVRVQNPQTGQSFHAVSFARISGSKIIRLDEYWGDDSEPPPWRRELGLSGPIHD